MRSSPGAGTRDYSCASSATLNCHGVWSCYARHASGDCIRGTDTCSATNAAFRFFRSNRRVPRTERKASYAKNLLAMSPFANGLQLGAQRKDPGGDLLCTVQAHFQALSRAYQFPETIDPWHDGNPKNTQQKPFFIITSLPQDTYAVCVVTRYLRNEVEKSLSETQQSTNTHF